MAQKAEMTTVFRSADESAEEDAAEVRARLTEAGIKAVALGDEAPGVVVGTWEVRVPVADQDRAEQIVTAALAEPEDDELEVPERDTSHDLDFVPVFSGQGIEAEMEATSIHSLLEANGIPSVVVGSSQIPSLPFEVRVPRSRREEAIGLLDAGPVSDLPN